MPGPDLGLDFRGKGLGSGVGVSSMVVHDTVTWWWHRRTVIGCRVEGGFPTLKGVVGLAIRVRVGVGVGVRLRVNAH